MAAAFAVGAPAHAAQIILNNLGGFSTAYFQEVQTAANFWADTIRNPIRLTFNVGMQDFGAAPIAAETTPGFVTESAQSVEAALAAHATSALDMTAVRNLPTLTNGGLSVVTPGYTDAAAKTGINTAQRLLDSDGSANNTEINLTTANAKALGFATPVGPDATILFDMTDTFDTNPINGIGVRSYDLIGAAIHEMGHALGFFSGVDTYDYVSRSYAANDSAMGDVLDLFRYSANPLGDGTRLSWAPGVASYFSVDGGATDLGDFSTGANHGDGFQAEHWLHSDTDPLGVMDPETNGGVMKVTQLDFDAFDAIGYSLRTDGVCQGDFSHCDAPNFLLYDPQFSNFQQQSVPEPAAWMLMILGFGGIGAALRHRGGQSARVA